MVEVWPGGELRRRGEGLAVTGNQAEPWAP